MSKEKGSLLHTTDGEFDYFESSDLHDSELRLEYKDGQLILNLSELHSKCDGEESVTYIIPNSDHAKGIGRAFFQAAERLNQDEWDDYWSRRGGK